MKKMAFISRHQPTSQQVALAEKAGFKLVAIGDRDAFTASLGDLPSLGYQAVAVVHPALALRAIEYFRTVGVFENAKRPGPDGKPTFAAKALHLYTIVPLRNELGVPMSPAVQTKVVELSDNV